MASACIMTVMPIPGLHRPFTMDDMKESTTMYNGLLSIQPDMHVNTKYIKELVEIIARHGQLENFGFHLVHRHDPIANNTVKLESDLRVVRGKWNRATLIDSLDLSNIHPVVIKFVPEQNRLISLEFGEGPSPLSASDVDVIHSAEGSQLNECTAEVEMGNLGTVVLPKSMVNGKEFLPTG